MRSLHFELRRKRTTLQAGDVLTFYPEGTMGFCRNSEPMMMVEDRDDGARVEDDKTVIHIRTRTDAFCIAETIALAAGLGLEPVPPGELCGGTKLTFYRFTRPWTP